MKLKKFTFLFLIAVQFVSAQKYIPKFDLGVSFIKNEYNGDYGSGIMNFGQIHSGIGLSLSTPFNPSFDFGLQGTYGSYGYKYNTANYFLGRKFDMSLFGHYKFDNGYLLSKDSKISPFASLGLGLATYSKSPGDKGVNPTIIKNGVDMIIPIGVGAKYKINDLFSVQYQYLYNFTIGKNADIHDTNRGIGTFFSGAVASAAGLSENGRHDFYGQHWITFAVKLGAKDTDGDGICDKKDKCNNTPKDVKVDAFGCPLDADADGVPDYLDKCPDTPSGAKVDANGCPVDTDGDGVADYKDKCSDTPKGVTVDTNGCPVDADFDGVADYMDKCPDSPRGAKVDASGCPLDTDGDGVADFKDKCPDTPNGIKVDSKGCPIDTDGDGVADYIDQCPTIAGVKENNGCPLAKTETKSSKPTVTNTSTTYEIKLDNILFETGKADINDAANDVISKALAFMNANPNAKLLINGHADSTGSFKTNDILSLKRAETVKNLLVQKGITTDRIATKGFGEKLPIADNNTAEGREKNRRVELKVK